jgi:hypothetical protein
MTTNDSSLPSVNPFNLGSDLSMDTSGTNVEKRTSKTMETIGIKLQEKRITKQKWDTTVKVETNADNASTLYIFPGAKAKLTELPTTKEQLKLRSHQMAKRIFNSEVNFISDWVVEHKPKKLSNKRYKRRIKITLIFFCVSRRSTVRLDGRYCTS